MKKTGYAVLTALILILACSCGTAEASRDFFAMDTIVSVKAYGSHSEEAVNAAANRINELEHLFSVTDSSSDIALLNSSGSAKVSDDTAQVISAALELCSKTDGALDITIYPVLREWGFTTAENHVPSDAELAAALAKTGYERVTLNENTVTLPEGYMLDLGSCAKGYAGSEMIAGISEFGITSALVNLGGNVQALGAKPDGSDWTVGIADPFAPENLLGTIGVRDKAVITSGGYQRYFTDDSGNVYIHILDPKSGRPADSGLASVTVIGDDGLMCDALSTALFVMGKERAVGYWHENGGFDMILVTNDRRIFITEGISEKYADRSGLPAEIIYE